MEAIGKVFGTPTKDLTLPVKKILAAKKIRVRGRSGPRNISCFD